MLQEEMSFKDISYLELLWPLCSVDRNYLCNFGRKHHEEQFCELILNSDKWFRRICRSNVFLIWSSGSNFCSAYQNHLCNFGRGYYEEQFCYFFFHFFNQPAVQEMSFKRFLICSSGGPPVRWSWIIYTILKEGITGSIHVKLYEI